MSGCGIGYLCAYYEMFSSDVALYKLSAYIV